MPTNSGRQYNTLSAALVKRQLGGETNTHSLQDRWDWKPKAERGQGGRLWGCLSHLRGTVEETTMALAREAWVTSQQSFAPSRCCDFSLRPNFLHSKMGGMVLTSQGDCEAQIK